MAVAAAAAITLIGWLLRRRLPGFFAAWVSYAILVAPVLPDEVFVTVGGGISPQMGQCVAISSRSSAGKPMLTKAIRFPK